MQDGGERIVSIKDAQSLDGDSEATTGGGGEGANNGNDINEILKTLAKRDEDLIVREKRLLKAERRIETRWELLKESMVVFNGKVGRVIKLCDKLLKEEGKKSEDESPDDAMEIQVDGKGTAKGDKPEARKSTTKQEKAMG